MNEPFVIKFIFDFSPFSIYIFEKGAMSMQPSGWSVVLIGQWNSAILSPSGIARYVFGLPPDTKMQVAVPLDGISSYLVSNPDETIIARVEYNRVQLDLRKFTYQTLQTGMSAGINTLTALPITPISAVGFNLNFETHELLQELIDITETALDTALGANGFAIAGRSYGRSLKFDNGKINLTILRTEEGFSINCNFHLDTTNCDEAKAWLSTPVERIKLEVDKISAVLKVSLKEA